MDFAGTACISTAERDVMPSASDARLLNKSDLLGPNLT
jgi:hypothetical protein